MLGVKIELVLDDHRDHEKLILRWLIFYSVRPLFYCLRSILFPKNETCQFRIQ